MINFIITFFSLLPEIINFVKWAHSKLEEGILLSKIKADMNKIYEAMALEDRKEAARRLDDIFRRKK